MSPESLSRDPQPTVELFHKNMFHRTMEVWLVNFATLNGKGISHFCSIVKFSSVSSVDRPYKARDFSGQDFYLSLFYWTPFVADLYISNFGSRSYFLFITLYKEVLGRFSSIRVGWFQFLYHIVTRKWCQNEKRYYLVSKSSEHMIYLHYSVYIV